MNRKYDNWLIFIVLTLIVYGLLMVFSASSGADAHGNGAEFKYLFRQLAALSVGLLLCVFGALMTSNGWRSMHQYLYIACMIALIGCFIPGIGHASHGAARWIGFGSINFQPSAFARIAVLISLATYLHKWRGQVHLLPVLLKSIYIPLGMLMLIIVEPDFGTSLVISALSFLMCVLGGMRLSHMLISMATLGSLGVVVLFSAEYRMRRMLTFWDPWSHRDADGYQVVQSWVAMHNGGLTGVGMGNSIAKRQFLPEPWTDFIGSVIAEEIGFVGIAVLLTLFCGLLWRGIHIATRAKDSFSMLLASTLTIMIISEAVFNLGVIMGLLPPKGLVLPFISYGSSAMMANLFAIGILLGISAESKDVPLDKGWKVPVQDIPSVANDLTIQELHDDFLGEEDPNMTEIVEKENQSA